MIHKLIFCVLLSSFSLYDHGAEELLSSAYAQQKKPVPKAQEIDFPDGLVGRRYNFVLTPENLVAPYKISIVSGSLPQGIALNQRMGGIEGEPVQAGQWQFTLQVVDAKGKKGLFAALVFILGRIDADDDFACESFSLCLQTLMVHGEPPWDDD